MIKPCQETMSRHAKTTILIGRPPKSQFFHGKLPIFHGKSHLKRPILRRFSRHFSGPSVRCSGRLDVRRGGRCRGRARGGSGHGGRLGGQAGRLFRHLWAMEDLIYSLMINQWLMIYSD